MAEAPHTHSLETPETLRVQEREWRFHRLGRIALGLFLAAAIAGVFGGGPLSRGTAGQKGGAIRVEYERFARDNGPIEMQIHVAAGQARDGQINLWVGTELLQALDVEQVLPKPVKVEAHADRYVYTFTAGHEQVLIVFAAKARQAGIVKGHVGIDGNAEVNFRQFLFP
jgi:hypothetical protein